MDTPLLSRDELIQRLTGFVGPELALKTATGLTDEQLSDCVAEHEMSQQFWEKWDDDVARDMAPGGRYYEPPADAQPHQQLGFDTADLDGQ
jgi:hypothetical protein